MLSVIMSVFNSEDYLERSISSILDQTYKDFEFLILDDCSTDNSLNIITDFSNRDSRIRVFQNKENIGLTKSLNYLINESKNEILARQDADDYSDEKRFFEQLEYLKSEKYSFCTTRAQTIQNSRVIPRFTFYFPQKTIIKYKNPYIHGSLMIKKQTIKKYGGYDENFYYSQDYKLFDTLLRNGEKGKYLKEICYYLNVENNISSLKRTEQKYYSNMVKKNQVPKYLLK